MSMKRVDRTPMRRATKFPGVRMHGTDCAALASTDSRQRRCSTQKAARRNRDTAFPGQSRKLDRSAGARLQPSKLVIRVRFPAPVLMFVRRLSELRQHLLADGGPFAPEALDFLETEYRVKMKRDGVICPGHVEHRLGTGEGPAQAGRGADALTPGSRAGAGGVRGFRPAGRVVGPGSRPGYRRGGAAGRG